MASTKIISFGVCAISPELGFAQFHGPTRDNPFMPNEELERLRVEHHPMIYRQVRRSLASDSITLVEPSRCGLSLSFRPRVMTVRKPSDARTAPATTLRPLPSAGAWSRSAVD
jgi:hypothetical protein